MLDAHLVGRENAKGWYGRSRDDIRKLRWIAEMIDSLSSIEENATLQHHHCHHHHHQQTAVVATETAGLSVKVANEKMTVAATSSGLHCPCKNIMLALGRLPTSAQRKIERENLYKKKWKKSRLKEKWTMFIWCSEQAFRQRIN